MQTKIVPSNETKAATPESFRHLHTKWRAWAMANRRGEGPLQHSPLSSGKELKRQIREQALNYAQSLERFIARLREGTAQDFGYHQIVSAFFAPEGTYGVHMTSRNERFLLPAHKVRIIHEVLAKTGLTEPEAREAVTKLDLKVKSWKGTAEGITHRGTGRDKMK